nr:sulfotransferase family 2 domain-containing protein [uncultured Halomonas sp.]
MNVIKNDLQKINLYNKRFRETRSIFIHIPKAGGTSIAKAIYGTDPGHIKLKNYMARDQKKFSSYFKFSFVRNPVDRVASTFFYLKKRPGIYIDKKHPFNEVGKYSDINDFVLFGLDRFIENKNYFFEPQVSYLSVNGEISLDFIGKLENINNDFSEVCKLLGVSKELKHLNQGKNSSYLDLFKKDSVDKIKKIYEIDFDVFKY